MHICIFVFTFANKENRNVNEFNNIFSMIERLKLYVEHTGLMDAQFAESIGMPRSSFSQLINGRNKTITDATIKKIHDAFPELSIAWLLFGEGKMLVDAVITKEGQQELNFATENKKFATPTVNENKYEQEIEAKKVGKDDRNSLTDAPTSEITIVKVEKKIAKIMVFYDDNSFECFKPE